MKPERPIKNDFFNSFFLPEKQMRNPPGLVWKVLNIKAEALEREEILIF